MMVRESKQVPHMSKGFLHLLLALIILEEHLHLSQLGGDDDNDQYRNN
jgi:hypothetical protein